MDKLRRWTIHILAQTEHPEPGYWKETHAPLSYLCGYTTHDQPYEGWDYMPRPRVQDWYMRHEYCIRCLERVADKRLLLAMKGDRLW